MCYISVFHFTHCDTRRPAIVNLSTGQALLHPFELPQHCTHNVGHNHLIEDPDGSAPCPRHGVCCYPGQIRVCDRNPYCSGWQAYHQVIDPSILNGYREHLDPITSQDWDEIDLNTEGFAYEEDIRRQFFDAGAKMWELAKKARFIVDNFHETQYYPNGGMEKLHFLEHGETYWEWMVARKELLQLTEAWESLANVGCMEVCPAKHIETHPHNHVFQKHTERQIGFPQFPGIPFSFPENYQRQEEILRWHPYYSRRDSPSEPLTVDRLWRSPAPPQPCNPELIRRVEAANQPWPGEWEGIVAARRNSLPLRDYAETSERATWGSAMSPGPEIPPWVVPYGEESFIDWKDIHWDQPATLVDSPLVSPKTVPPTKEAQTGPSAGIVQISSLPYDVEDIMEENLYWFNRMLGSEKPPTQDYLCVSVLELDAGKCVQSLKRRLSEADLDDGQEGMRGTKRYRSA